MNVNGYKIKPFANLRGADLEDANLRGANLEGANLRSANLGGADLEGADLGGANLEDAELEDANLRGANLEDANLRGANLRGAITLSRIPVGDPRGYDAFAIFNPESSDWIIGSGCQYLSIEDAREHWGDGYGGNRNIGDLYLHGIEWLMANSERLLSEWGIHKTEVVEA